MASNIQYDTTSPYFNTPLSSNGQYLDLWVESAVPASSSDASFLITARYNQRPDLLAHDLYGDSRLWWVFAVRNPNAIQDPLGDFVAGLTIWVPNSIQLKQNLGL